MMQTILIKNNKMKSILFLFMVLIVPILCDAQSKTIELYDLIKTLVIDSAKQANEVSWNSLKTNKEVQWSKLTSLGNNEYSVSAILKITIDGRPFPSTAANPWTIYLVGNAKSYYRISISSGESSQRFETPLDGLFKKKQYGYKQLNCENAANDAVFYEVKIGGKKPFWLVSMKVLGAQKGNSGINIECSFTQKSNLYCN